MGQRNLVYLGGEVLCDFRESGMWVSSQAEDSEVKELWEKNIEADQLSRRF